MGRYDMSLPVLRGVTVTPAWKFHRDLDMEIYTHYISPLCEALTHQGWREDGLEVYEKNDDA